MAVTLVNTSAPVAVAADNATQDISLVVSAGVGRRAVVGIPREYAVTITSVTFDPASIAGTFASRATAQHGGGTQRIDVWDYEIADNVPAATYTCRVVLSAGLTVNKVTLTAFQLAGVIAGAPEDTDTQVNTGVSTALTCALTCSADAYILAWAQNGAATVDWSWSGDVTAINGNINETNYSSGTAGGAIAVAGAKTAVATPSGTANDKVAVAVSYAPIVGPTITVQPTAQTARLNGDTAPTATFSVTATGTGTLTYDWELEDSVGAGTYTNTADGNGATWTGRTTASHVGTFTATTLSGRRLRCNVTDDNGTTTTDAVALTVLNGPVLSAASATTNGSGVASVTATTDDVLSVNGELYLVTASINGTVIGRTTFRGT